MRDIIVTLMVFGSLPFILRNAYFGVLVWSWLSYMNPHKLGWGFAQNMPFAQIVALTVFAALLFNREKKRIPADALTVTWVLLLIWMAITTYFAFYTSEASQQLIKIYKIQLVTFLTMLLIHDQKRIDLLIWVIVGSIGFFSIKGGVFTILTGGAFRVYGPPGGFIQENNALAVATLMIVPLMVYLYHTSNHRRVRQLLTLAIVLSLMSVIGSQSRGALIAIVAVGFFFWLNSKTKLISGTVIVLMSVLIFTFMPVSWHERMDTIGSYQEDASAMSRINSWQYSINVANDRLTGAGLESWRGATFAIYAPDPNHVFVAHSIYFSMLADHGWIGLLMFLLILFLFWRHLSRIIKATKNQPEYEKQNFLARMLQVSIIAYMSGGAFLSLSYFDLPWHLIAIAVVLKAQVFGEKQHMNQIAAKRNGFDSLHN